LQVAGWIVEVTTELLTPTLAYMSFFVLSLYDIFDIDVIYRVPTASRKSGQMLKMYRNHPEILDTFGGYMSNKIRGRCNNEKVGCR
jgi:hypothetical protein